MSATSGGPGKSDTKNIDMRTTKIITITLLLATLFVGCKKENNGRISIFAEKFSNNSKVAIDPTDLSVSAEWVAGETIDLNGNVYTVSYDATDDGYFLSDAGHPDGVAPLSTDMYAFYPGGSFGGNDVTVTNNADGTGEIVLNRLLVNIRTDGMQEMAFPMVAHADADNTKLPFRHLSGGFRIRLLNTTANEVKVASLKIVAQSTSDVKHLGYDFDGDDVFDVTARWAVQGPSVPNGGIGGSDDDVDVRYTSEMYFDIKQGTENFVTIADGDNSPYFCIPVTISKVKNLTVIGYNVDGTECFRATKKFDQEYDVERNKMYNLPEIEIR